MHKWSLEKPCSKLLSSHLNLGYRLGSLGGKKRFRQQLETVTGDNGAACHCLHLANLFSVLDRRRTL